MHRDILTFSRVGVAILLLSVAAVARAQDPAVGNPTYATPQKTFEAFRAGLMNGDYSAYCKSLSPNYLDEQTGWLRLLGSFYQAGEPTDESGRQMKVRVKEVMTRFVPADASSLTFPLNGTEEEVRAILLESAKPVREREAFVSDMLKAVASAFARPGGKRPMEDSKLSDLSVAGDTASGTISERFVDGKPATIKFSRVEGDWKVDALSPLPEPQVVKP